MKITYLFGAGASAMGVPTSDKFNVQLRLFLDAIASSTGKLTSPTQATPQTEFVEITGKMLQEAELLYAELTTYTSLDVYARQLYLTSQSLKSRQFKALVSAFLIFHQLENRLDKRYDHFIANILDRNDKGEINLPMELLMLSWNYDFQLESAAANYFREQKVARMQEILNFYPRVQLQDLEREMLNKFSVIKLNGTAAGTMPDDSSYVPLQFSLKAEEGTDVASLRNTRLGEAILHYHSFSNSSTSIVSDIMNSWEISPIQKRMRSYLKYKSYNTDVLVIIGYSYPTFNRRFDRELLANMQLLKEVCIQAPSNEIQGIADRFYALLGQERVLGMGKSNNPVKVRLIEIKTENQDDEFYVPFQASTF
jgi:hypothetical protein